MTSDLLAVGQTPSAGEQVLRLAQLAKSCGLDGVVCSAHEIAALRAATGTRISCWWCRASVPPAAMSATSAG